MIDILIGILIFVYIWITTNLVHEMMHCFGVFIQGGKDAKMFVNFKGMGMYMTYDGDSVANKRLVSYAGGLFTFPIMIIMSLITSGFISIVFLFMGLTQLTYGIFEGLYIRRISQLNYVLGRYAIYTIYIIVMMVYLIGVELI